MTSGAERVEAPARMLGVEDLHCQRVQSLSKHQRGRGEQSDTQ